MKSLPNNLPLIMQQPLRQPQMISCCNNLDSQSKRCRHHHHNHIKQQINHPYHDNLKSSNYKQCHQMDTVTTTRKVETTIKSIKLLGVIVCLVSVSHLLVQTKVIDAQTISKSFAIEEISEPLNAIGDAISSIYQQVGDNDSGGDQVKGAQQQYHHLEKRSANSGYHAPIPPKGKTQVAISIERVKNPDDEELDQYGKKIKKKKKFPITWLRNQYPFNANPFKKTNKQQAAYGFGGKSIKPMVPLMDPMTGQYSSNSYDVLDPNPSTWIQIPNRPTASIKFQKQESISSESSLVPGSSLQQLQHQLQVPLGNSLPIVTAPIPLMIPPNELLNNQNGADLLANRPLNYHQSVAHLAAHQQAAAQQLMMVSESQQNNYNPGPAVAIGGPRPAMGPVRPQAAPGYGPPGDQASGEAEGSDQASSGFGGISLSLGNGRSISFGGGQGLTIGGRAGAISIGGSKSSSGSAPDEAQAASGYSAAEAPTGYKSPSSGYSSSSSDYVSKHPTMSMDMPRKGKKIVHLNTDMAPMKVRVHSSPRVKITTGSRDPLEKPSDEELAEEEEDIFEPPEPFPKRNTTSSSNETDSAANMTTTITPMNMTGDGLSTTVSPINLSDGSKYPPGYQNQQQFYNNYHQHHYRQQLHQHQHHYLQSSGFKGPAAYSNNRYQQPQFDDLPNGFGAHNHNQAPQPGLQHYQTVSNHNGAVGNYDHHNHHQQPPVNQHRLHYDEPIEDFRAGQQPPPQYRLAPASHEGQQAQGPMQMPVNQPRVNEQQQQPMIVQQQDNLPQQPPQMMMQPPSSPQIAGGPSGEQIPANEQQQQPTPPPAVDQWRQYRKQMGQSVGANQQQGQQQPVIVDANLDENARFYNGGHPNSIVESPAGRSIERDSRDPVEVAASGQLNVALKQAAASSKRASIGEQSEQPRHEQFNSKTMYQFAPAGQRQRVPNQETRIMVKGAEQLQQQANRQLAQLQPINHQVNSAKVQKQQHQQLQPQASNYHHATQHHNQPNKVYRNQPENQRQQQPQKYGPSVYSSHNEEAGEKTYTIGSDGISTHYGPAKASSYGSSHSSASSYGHGHSQTVPSDGFDQKNYQAKVETFEVDAHDKREKSKVIVFMKPRISIHMANSSTTTRKPKNQQRLVHVITKPIFLNTTNMTHHDEEFIDPDLAEPMDVPSYGYGYGYGHGYGKGYYKRTSTSSTTTKKPKMKTTTTTTTSSPTTTSEAETTTTSSGSSETEGTTTTTTAAPSTTTAGSSSEENSSPSISTTTESSDVPSSTTDATTTSSTTPSTTTGESSSSPTSDTSEETSIETDDGSKSKANPISALSTTGSPSSTTDEEFFSSTSFSGESETTPASADLVMASTEQVPTTTTIVPITTTTTTTTTTPRPPPPAKKKPSPGKTSATVASIKSPRSKNGPAAFGSKTSLAKTSTTTTTTSTTSTTTTRKPTTTTRKPTTTTTSTTTTTTTSAPSTVVPTEISEDDQAEVITAASATTIPPSTTTNSLAEELSSSAAINDNEPSTRSDDTLAPSNDQQQQQQQQQSESEDSQETSSPPPQPTPPTITTTTTTTEAIATTIQSSNRSEDSEFTIESQPSKRSALQSLVSARPSFVSTPKQKVQKIHKHLEHHQQQQQVANGNSKTKQTGQPMLLNDELIDKLMRNKTLVGLMSSQLNRIVDTDNMSDQQKQRIVRQVFEQMMEKKVDFSMNNVRLAVKTVSSSYREAIEKQQQQKVGDKTTSAGNVDQTSDQLSNRRNFRSKTLADMKSFGRRSASQQQASDSKSFQAIDTALKLTAKESSSLTGTSGPLESSGNQADSKRNNPIVVVLLPQEKAAAAA